MAGARLSTRIEITSPVLLEAFQSRVSASLLHAAGDEIKTIKTDDGVTSC